MRLYWPRHTRAGRRTGGLFLPLSLVAAEGKSGVALGDALDVPDGMGALVEEKAGLFIPDWKDKHRDKAAAFFGTPKCHTPARIVRTHTAIDSDNVAADQMLFTTIARSNLDAALSPRPGLVEIDMSKVKNGGHAAALHALLDEGLDGIGKTSARATFTKIGSPKGAAAVKPVQGSAGDFAVVLRTPALLLAGPNRRATTFPRNNAICVASCWRLMQTG